MLPIAALSNVELRCCCDTGLVGYRMVSPVAVPEVRKLRRWGLKKDKKDGKEGKELLAAPLVPEAGVECSGSVDFITSEELESLRAWHGRSGSHDAWTLGWQIAWPAIWV